MSDRLEMELRQAFMERADAVSPEREVRLQAFDDRSYRGHRRRLWAAIAAAGTALTGGAVTAIVLLTSGASIAYAGWSRVPTVPTSAALAAAMAACKTIAARPPLSASVHGGVRSKYGAITLTGQPVLIDGRGRYVSLIYVEGGVVEQCITPGDGGGGGVEGPVPATPVPDAISTANVSGAAPTTSTSDTGSGTPIVERRLAAFKRALQELPGFKGSATQFMHHMGFNGLVVMTVRGDDHAELSAWIRRQIPLLSKIVRATTRWNRKHHSTADIVSGDPFGDAFGRAGSKVVGVTFSFANGKTVVATVEHGWYFAWWPWTGMPTSTHITTNTGR